MEEATKDLTAFTDQELKDELARRGLRCLHCESKVVCMEDLWVDLGGEA